MSETITITGVEYEEITPDEFIKTKLSDKMKVIRYSEDMEDCNIYGYYKKKEQFPIIIGNFFILESGIIEVRNLIGNFTRVSFIDMEKALEKSKRIRGVKDD